MVLSVVHGVVSIGKFAWELLGLPFNQMVLINFNTVWLLFFIISVNFIHWNLYELRLMPDSDG